MGIVVVYGGMSTEREVSLRSGKAVYDALCNYGFSNVKLFDLHKDNISDLISMKPDLAYLALHGKWGEDGCIQGALELAGIAYTGPGVASSAICMNKIYTKNILKNADIPTADYLEVHRTDMTTEELCKTIIETIGVPVVLKSPCQGSSIGVEIVKDHTKLKSAIESIFNYGDQLLAEQFISGTEVTLPIIGNEEITVLPEIEIVSEREFYDYEAKYTSGLFHHIVPSRISEENRKKVIEIGTKVYRLLNLCGISRIDFIVNELEGPYVIEVNTLPGMTETSLVPDSARAAGICFPELVAKIAEYGLSKGNENK